MRELTAASRSLNLTAGGFCNLANCSNRLNSFIFSVSAPKGTPRWVPSVRLKRSFLLLIPICSIMVRPAPGTYSRASFSDGSIVMRYSPGIVGSTAAFRSEAVVLAAHPHLFHHGEAGARHVQQGVLLGWVHRHAVLTGHRGIDELNDDVGSHALNVAVAPLFERVSGCGAAALFQIGRAHV